MSDRDPIDETVDGERDATLVHRARSVQSRMSNVLALGLMSALGLGALTWYYANTMQRRTDAKQGAQAASKHRAQGDLPLPPLGRIEAPMPIAVIPSAGAPAEVTTASTMPAAAMPLSLGEAPPLYTIAPNGYGYGQSASGYGAPPAKTPAQLDLERRLSGAAFASENSTPASPGPAIAEQAGQFAGTSAILEPGAAAARAAEATGADVRGLAPLLRPSVTASVRAQVLPTMRLLLPKGAFIDCTLETAIDSTLPGMTTCITATDTFGVDGKVVLLERGTKLVGEVRGQVDQGAARIFVLWSEARTPTGVIVPLASPGADELGRAGLSGAVDRHFWERFGAAMLVSVIDGAVQAAVQSSNRGGGTVIYNPSGAQGVMTEVLKGTINIPPTITKQQGDRIQVLVARDLDFRSVYELRSASVGR